MSFNRDHVKSLGLTLTGITVSLLGANGAIAQATSGPSPCNARDVQVVMLIEDHGTANDVAPGKIGESSTGAVRRSSRMFRLPCNGGDYAL
jgi:hypothetical protein